MIKRIAGIIIGLAIAFTATATDYYVSTTGSNTTGNGTSTNPWQTITYALSKISGTGHTLYVEEGLYDTSLGEVFPIYIKNGVSLIGEGDSLTVIDASYSERVLNCIGITDASTVIEGFTITGGYYSDTFTEGAGIFISAGSALTIRNNLIMDNYVGTWGMGGAIYMTNSSPRILNNTIYYNGADYWGEGDALYIYESSPLVQGNQIVYNLSEASYNTIYVYGSSSLPRFINNVIAGNSAGIECFGGVPTFINNTISDNTGHGITLSGCQPDSVVNNIISFNSGYGIYEGGTTSDPEKVSYNLFYANSSGVYYDEGSTAYFTADDLNTAVSECLSNIDLDPLFADRSNFDYHLGSYSPAIDAGDPNSLYSYEPEPNGGRINMGAYGNTAEAATTEEPPVLPADLYVDALSGSNDTGDGSSISPWKTITYALSQIYTSGHVLHIAPGNYNPVLGESFPIVIKNGVSLSGADNATTIIDAAGSSSNYVQVMQCIGITDASTFIEELTITGGYLDYSTYGGGIYISAGSVLTIRHNVITDNYLSSSGYGGAFYINNSSPVIEGNLIGNNTAYYGNGSAFAMYNSSPLIRNNEITGNPGTGTSNCIYISGSSGSPRIINNVIAWNSGDGISCTGGTPDILNNTISDNTSDGIYIGSAISDSIVNNIISFNGGYGIFESSSTKDAGLISYNLFYQNVSGLMYDENANSYYKADDMNSGISECEFNIEGDPLFIDKSAYDYHELAYSPAIDAGHPLLPYGNEPEDNGDRINIGAYGNTFEAAIHSDPPFFPADLYVNASSGNDVTGDGSSGNPWKTITHALSGIYTTGHTIHVASGTYDAALGEIFPVSMKNGVSLSGEEKSTTIINAGDNARVVNCVGITESTTFIEGVTITGGYLEYGSRGAGIYISGGSLLTVRDNIISGNYLESTGSGAGIYIYSSAPKILNNHITGNSAYYGNGGAISLYSSSPLIKGNVILNNTGSNASNAVHIDGLNSTPRLLKNLIARNTGDGVGCYEGNPVLINNTITDNTGDGIQLDYGCYPDSVINNILSYNSGYGINESGTSCDPSKVWYNLFYTNSSGLFFDEGATGYYTAATMNTGVAECSDNIEGDPVYKDRTTNDYYLWEGSPAIDAGDPGSPLDPDGSRADIGAFYYIMPPPDAPVANSPSFVGQTDMILSWNTSATGSGYVVDLATDAGFTSYVSGFQDLDVSNTDNWSVTGLTANTTYYFRVRAYNDGGTSDNSNVLSAVTLATLPAVPGAPVVFAGSEIVQTSFVASWGTSANATSYRIDVATDATFGTYISGYINLEVLNATELTISGLTDNSSYVYRVRACNSGGCSDNSEVISVTTLAYPPPAPVNVTVSDILQNSLTINWDTVAEAAGYYVDVATDESFTSLVVNNYDTFSMNQHPVSGLTSGTTYWIRVRAYNGGGAGDYSATVSTTTLPDPPSVYPENIYADEVSQTSFTMNWDAVATATGYDVEVSVVNDFSTHLPGYDGLDVGNVTSHTITELTSNTTYYVLIQAYNEGGYGPDSWTVDVTTLPDPPPAPVANNATDIAQENFTANWESASTATGYLIEVATDIDFTQFVGDYNGMVVDNVLNYIVTGLLPNTTYYYRITSYNSGGTGGYSNPVTVTTLQIPAPDAPVANDPSYVGQTDLTASWNSSEGATGYYLDVATDDGFVTFVTNYDNVDVGDVTSYSVSGLTANTTYYYRVRAYNAGGTSANSNTITLTTLLNPPDPPSAPEAYSAADITQTSFTASWSTVTDATGYKFDLAADGSFTSFVAGYEDADMTNTTSLGIDGLTASTDYYYRVRAYNSGGSSSESNIITVTTLPEPPAAPEAFDATNITTTSFTANWGSSATADGYYIDIATDNSFTSYITGYENRDIQNSLSCDISGLSISTTYYYRIRAYNSGGVSSNSNDVNLTTLAEMPPVPEAPAAYAGTNVSQTGFTASWSASAGATGYILDVAGDADFTEWVASYAYAALDVGNVLSYDVTGLESSNDYYYRVAPYNITGTGSPSNVVTVNTLPDPPPAPTGLTASSCNDLVYLSWDQSEESSFDHYTVFVGTSADNTPVWDIVEDISDPTYTVSGLTNGETYYFRVKTVNTPDVRSDFSSAVSAIVKTGAIPQIKAKWGRVLICYNPGGLLSEFRWYRGSTLISGETKQYYYVPNTQTGTYYVEATDTDGCINSSNSIDVGGSKSLSVFPNPAKESFMLILSSEALGEAVVSIINSAGIKSLEYRTEKSKELLECLIPVDKLQDGIYTVEVIVNEEEINYTRLIIIE